MFAVCLQEAYWLLRVSFVPCCFAECTYQLQKFPDKVLRVFFGNYIIDMLYRGSIAFEPSFISFMVRTIQDVILIFLYLFKLAVHSYVINFGEYSKGWWKEWVFFSVWIECSIDTVRSIWFMMSEFLSFFPLINCLLVKVSCWNHPLSQFGGWCVTLELVFLMKLGVPLFWCIYI